MSNFYNCECYPSPTGMCYVTDPCYEQDTNVWAQCEYCGVCYNVFLTPRDNYGGGVDLNQCKKEITKHGKMVDFIKTFDWSQWPNVLSPTTCMECNSGVSWLGNACCQFSDNAAIADAYNYAESPVADWYDVCQGGCYRDWYGYRKDHDFAMALNPFLKERMCEQVDYLSIYGNWKEDGCSGYTCFGLCDCRCTLGTSRHSYCAKNGKAWECFGNSRSSMSCCVIDSGWLIPYERPYACAFLCMSQNGTNQFISEWGGEPYDGAGWSCTCCGTVTCWDTCQVCCGQGSCSVCCGQGSCSVCYDSYTCSKILQCSVQDFSASGAWSGALAECNDRACWMFRDGGGSYDLGKKDGQVILNSYEGSPVSWTYGGATQYSLTAVAVCIPALSCVCLYAARYCDSVCADMYDGYTELQTLLSSQCGGYTINAHPFIDTVCGCCVIAVGVWRANGQDSYAFPIMYNKYVGCVLRKFFEPTFLNYDKCVSYTCNCYCTCYYDEYCTCCYDEYCTCCYSYQCDVYQCTQLEGSCYVWREPCETDGVLYFGLPNYAVGSIPIKRIKCVLDYQPSTSYMRNESYRSVCWSARDMAFNEANNKFKFCFITFPNCDPTLIGNVPKMMSCAIWYYLCSYKCEAGQYVQMCKTSLNMLDRDICGSKMTYYSFQGYSVGGAYIK